MAEKLLKKKAHKVSPKKKPEEQAKKTVLVGTYKGDQLEKWPGYYNYPISSKDKIDVESAKKVNELWLFQGAKAGRYFSAEYVGTFTRDELKTKFGYPAKGKPHGDKYLLYKITKTDIYDPATGLAEAVIVRAKDFKTASRTGRQIKAYLESPERNDPVTANLVPKILTKLPREVLRVCEAAVQMEFGFCLYPIQSIVGEYEIQKAIAESRGKGKLTCVEICAGAGGQAIGLERAGFEHIALVEYESEYCEVLRNNKPKWNVICADVHQFDGSPYVGVDLLAGGVPCPPFSVASKQLGERDERDLFPEAIRLISEIKPRAIMLENVRGLLDPKFDVYRNSILERIRALGYVVQIKLLQASDYGVPQIRPRVVIVGMRLGEQGVFTYPPPEKKRAPSVGESLRNMMGANGWSGLDRWVSQANKVAPTIVGGSKKHGGPDLGPTRARRAWAELGVDGLGVANEAPSKDFVGMPKLTKEMIAAIQGFPPNWNFGKKKTLACRMIGNAFPPPVANAIGRNIRKALNND